MLMLLPARWQRGDFVLELPRRRNTDLFTGMEDGEIHLVCKATKRFNLMFELPLFPLNTVLFPGTPLHLHIFEERYKRMIGMCLQEHKPFGVILIRQGSEALGPLAEPHAVGCTANISQTQQLEQGRMNIVVIGQERFRVLSVDSQSHPYLLGNVEPFPLTVDDAAGLALRATRLRSQVERFLNLLANAGSSQFDMSQLPQDPLELAYVAAAILQISPLEKQGVLELALATDLVGKVYTLYRRELVLLQTMLAHIDRDRGMAFSRN